MPELDELRGLAGRIRQPSLEAIVSTARRRRRRAMTTAVSVGATVALLAGASTLLTGYDDRSAPPAHDPAPGPTTPERIVTGEGSRLIQAATSLDDLDVRIAVWEADCPDCEPGAGRPTGSALALTTDGFSSTTYVTNPIDPHPKPGELSEYTGPRIESPTRDLFLIIDTEKPDEWLVRSDGTMQRVERVTTKLAPTDPRLWFRCHPTEKPAAWKGVPIIDPAHLFPWCALDPDSATAYEWPARWNGSVPLPVAGEEPWGIDDRWQPTFAWWEVDGQRLRRFLADGVGDARGKVWNFPTHGPLFFTRLDHEPEIELLVPGEGTDAQIVRRDAPDAPFTTQFDLMTGTPDGALLAVQTSPETAIWRAEDLDRGDFELVEESATNGDTELTQSAWTHEPIIVGDRIYVMTRQGVATSDDDGHTWTEITTWR
ncbi:hypothetical protein GCM10009844_14230 [Nocardioides koreensis]|uniref:Exo-alpha-sialidase n=1 Tax=Nocardioides koreensis TaxID=433651 RepID=A0ABN2ZIZ3_9ACTN